jgi:DNA-binding transcriptional LysR family regulator
MADDTHHLLRDIALFVEVVRARGFTGAAERLGMPVSTLSRRVARLEARIGLSLLTRTTRQVALTDAGAAYYARCEPLVDEARLAHEQLAELVHVATGTLRLACPGDFATFRLAPVLAEFARTHPAVRIELLLNTRGDLVSDNIDAAIRIGTLPDSSLITRRIGTLQHELYAAPAYLERASTPAMPADLVRHECIRMTADASDYVTQWRLTRGTPPQAETARVPVNGRFVAGSMSMVREFTLLGLGVGAIDVQLANQHLREGRLVRVLPEWGLPAVPAYLVTPSRLMSARLRLFSDLLAERLEWSGQDAAAAAAGTGRERRSPRTVRSLA